MTQNSETKKRAEQFSKGHFTASSDNTSAAAGATSYDDDLGIGLVENPLVDAVNGQEAHAGYDHISVSVLKNKERTSSLSRKYPEEAKYGSVDNIYHQKLPSRYPYNTTELKHTFYAIFLSWVILYIIQFFLI